MRPLSATEAIGPAVERTKDILVRPFHWRTFLKLAAVAFFAEIGGGSGGGGGGNSSSTTHTSSMFAGSLSPGIIAILVVAGVAFFIVALILFYISSRLQLVLVELVATRQTIITPMWRRYSSLTWRWIGLKLLFFFAVVLLTILLGGPFLVFAVRGGFHPSFFGILLLIVVGLGFLLVLVAAFILLRDFALPFITLEDLSISDALSRVRSIVAADPGQVALYLVLRVVLAIAAAIGCEIAALLIFLISLIPFAIVGGILWFALHGAGTAGTVILIACAVVGGMVLLCWMLCVGIALFGPLFMFFQAYALYFLGGHYPLLGDILQPPPPYFPPVALEPPMAPA